CARRLPLARDRSGPRRRGAGDLDRGGASRAPGSGFACRGDPVAADPRGAASWDGRTRTAHGERRSPRSRPGSRHGARGVGPGSGAVRSGRPPCAVRRSWGGGPPRSPRGRGGSQPALDAARRPPPPGTRTPRTRPGAAHRPAVVRGPQRGCGAGLGVGSGGARRDRPRLPSRVGCRPAGGGDRPRGGRWGGRGPAPRAPCLRGRRGGAPARRRAARHPRRGGRGRGAGRGRAQLAGSGASTAGAPGARAPSRGAGHFARARLAGLPPPPALGAPPRGALPRPGGDVVSTQTGSEPEIAKAREMRRALSSARQVYALYPDGHPKRREAAQELLSLVLELREAKGGGHPVLFVSEGNFYYGTTLLAWESLTLYRLAQAMGDAGVQSLEFLPNPTEADTDALVRLLTGDERGRDVLVAVAVNRAGPSSRPEELQRGIAELLRNYAVGLELLRETAARLLAGRPADMDATVRLTEHLADLIAADTAQALLLTTIKSYDEYTYHHMVNVCILSLAIARASGLSKDQAVVL